MGGGVSGQRTDRPTAAPWLVRVFISMLAACVLALSGCGGGGGSGEPEQPVIPGNFFPLAEGDRWFYDWNGAAEASVRVTGRRTVQGEQGWVVQTYEPGGNYGESVYLVSADRVRQVPVYLPDPVLQAVGAIDVMRLPPRQGDRFVQVDQTVDPGLDLDGDGRPDAVAVRSEVLVVGAEPVDTPAGRLDGALHQRTTMTLTTRPSSGGSADVLEITSDDWYAPDLGPVRGVLVTRLNGQVVESTTFGLTAYRVGNRRSEAIAPSVASVDPADGAVRPAVSGLTVTFSETVDAATAASAFSLRDGNGQLVAGTVQVEGAVLQFRPAQALPGGRYSARLAATVEDRAGNALAGEQTWRFEVDTTAPGLLDSMPADGATDVARDGAIVLRFSEPLDPASVDAGTVVFSAGAASLVVDGATVTLTPAATLARLTDYTVQVTPGVRDRSGNPMASGAVIHFRTDVGRFALPVALPAAAAPGVVLQSQSPMAIGDVDGDGRADILAAGYDGSSFPGTYHLMVWRQRADGSRGPADTVALAAVGGGCWPTAIEVGDLDGDGRNDVAIGQPGCGITLLLQSADGRLLPGPFLAGAAADKIRLADLDGDGRLEIIGVDPSGVALQIWRRDAGGAYALAAAPALATAFQVDLAVGDLNGDGRPDLAVAGVSPAGSPLAVLLQRPDGSFAAPVYLPSGGPGVVIGDVDGDGRQDLVSTIASNAPAYVVVYRQLGDGSLATPALLPSYDIPKQIAAVDVNGDGRRDLIVGHAGWGRVGVYLQQAGGTLAAEARYPANVGSFNPRAMAVGDVDGDGRPDIVVEGQLLRQLPVGMQSEAVPPWSGASRAALRLLHRQVPATAR